MTKAKKYLATFLVLGAVCGAIILPGCSGVIMNSEYSTLLDKTAALSAKTATRATAGQLTADEMKAALTSQAATWQKFKDARDGVAK